MRVYLRPCKIMFIPRHPSLAVALAHEVAKLFEACNKDCELFRRALRYANRLARAKEYASALKENRDIRILMACRAVTIDVRDYGLKIPKEARDIIRKNLKTLMSADILSPAEVERTLKLRTIVLD